MTPELIASIAAVVLSLLFSYVPGFAPWFEPLQPNTKRLIMLTLLVVVSASSLALACAGIAAGKVACDRAGAVDLLKAFIAAMIANQAAYQLSPKRDAPARQAS